MADLTGNHPTLLTKATLQGLTSEPAAPDVLLNRENDEIEIFSSSDDDSNGFSQREDTGVTDNDSTEPIGAKGKKRARGSQDEIDDADDWEREGGILSVYLPCGANSEDENLLNIAYALPKINIREGSLRAVNFMQNDLFKSAILGFPPSGILKEVMLN
ncbi:hypothetical protein N7540_012501 [Penicillium herquei]|nr:hypothetical protein N7540_012501 [Penicillium herquei]